MTLRWIELSCTVDREAVEPVADLFRREGRGGVIVEEPIIATGDWGGWESDPDQPVTVRTYLTAGRGAAARQKRIEKALWHLGQLRPVSALTSRELDEVDWAEAWKSHYDVHRIGERIVIKPTWREFEAGPADIVVELDPGMAFGTGLHPTTRLCLKGLETGLQPGDRALDLGTGSGILAIAAAKLGAEHVLAIDLDPVAVFAAKANIEVNGLSDRISVLEGAVEAAGDGPFDLALANISGKIVQAVADDLARLVRPGGLVIASGFLDEQEVPVALALAAAGFSITASAADGDWRRLDARRDSTEYRVPSTEP